MYLFFSFFFFLLCMRVFILILHCVFSQAGGQYFFWAVPLGRRDGTTASQSAANEQLPSPFEPLENITSKFTSKGLDIKDLVLLSGLQHRLDIYITVTLPFFCFNYKISFACFYIKKISCFWNVTM